MHLPIPNMKPDQNLAAGNQGSREGCDHREKNLSRQVEERPPAKDAAHRGVRQAELGSGADREVQSGMAAAGVFDHARREVHSGDTQAERSKVSGDRPGTAADIEHRAKRPDLLREGRQRSPQPRPRAQITDVQRDVLVGYSVVGPTDKLEVNRVIFCAGHEHAR